ncbi:hypothetical protein B0H12DRAFT_316791 [Mycena haematopus]|nr:hypothetical protein B0H12DRAFT_316791 [Mycena haematopus]
MSRYTLDSSLPIQHSMQWNEVKKGGNELDARLQRWMYAIMYFIFLSFIFFFFLGQSSIKHQMRRARIGGSEDCGTFVADRLAQRA